MSCTGRLRGGSVLPAVTLLLVVLTAPATGQEQYGAATLLDKYDVVDLLSKEGNKWANAYLPTAVSPTSPCGQALQAMFDDLTNNTTIWAATMVDAWGKTSDGIAYGNFMFTGLYDECLAASSPDGKVKGKYCQVTTYVIGDKAKQEGQSWALAFPKKPFRPGAPWLAPFLQKANWEPQTVVDSIGTTQTYHGTCMPDVCTGKELAMSVNLNLIGQKTFATVICPDEKEKSQFSDGDVGFMALITFLLVLLLCSSLVDIYLTYTGNKTLRKGPLKYLLVFSAYTNLAKITQVNPDRSPGTITCLHGMRVLSMTWVLYSHQQSTTIFSMPNFLSLGKWTEGIAAQTITNGFPSVDTFFFFSGLLVTYSVLRQLGRRGKFNVGLFYFHRFIRLIPPIGITAGFMATVLRFLVSGPYAYIWTEFWQQNCIKYWWKDVVFVNNFISEDGDCLVQTWYVSVDTQLYVIAPLVILPLFFYEATGKAWLFLVTVLSAVIPAAIIYANNYPPTSLMYQPAGSNEYFRDVYLRPWCRAEPWVAGVWLGYIFYKQGDKRVKMSALMVTVGWTVASITGLLVVYGLASYNTILHPAPYEMMTQVVYGGGHRLAWGAALAWLVFACHNGYGGIVDDFLSHPIWQPISRLTYCLYLVAFPMQFLLAYNLRVGPYYSYVNKIIETVGALVLTFPVATLVSLMAESPVMGLERLLLRPSPRPSNKPGNNTSQPSKPSQPNSNESTGGFRNPAFTPQEDSIQGEKRPALHTNTDEHEMEKNAEDAKVTPL